MRNHDLRNHLPGLVVSIFEFHSSFAETFSTASTRSRPRVCSATGSPANWTFVGDRMQFDQLKRREFISLLARRSSVAEGTSAYACRWS